MEGKKHERPVDHAQLTSADGKATCQVELRSGADGGYLVQVTSHADHGAMWTVQFENESPCVAQG